MQLPASSDQPRLTRWPGKGSQKRHPVAEGATNAELLAEATPPAAKISWFWIEESVPTEVPTGAGISVSPDGKKLALARVEPEYFSKSWRVQASHNGKTDHQDFRLVKRDASVTGTTEPPPPPGEWDQDWAVGVGVAALLVTLVFGVVVWSTLGDSAPDSFVAHTVAALLVIGTGALAAAVVAALVEIRGRMRAKQAIAESLSRGGLPTDLIPDATEFVKAFGALREVAALAVTSMVLFAGAFLLAWEKFPDAGGSDDTPALGVTVLAKVAKSNNCTLSFLSQGRPTTQVTPGSYTVSLRDPGPKVRVALLREGAVVMRSSRPGAGRTSAQLELEEGTYSARCSLQGRPETAKDLAVKDD